MATIHIREIHKILLALGRGDRTKVDGKQKIEVLEIRFDDPEKHSGPVIDEDYINVALSIETDDSSGVIQFDHRGLLRSIDFS